MQNGTYFNKFLEGNVDLWLGRRVWTVFLYLENSFEAARFVDPANTSNILSDDLTGVAKQAISRAAATALAEPYWEGIIR